MKPTARRTKPAATRKPARSTKPAARKPAKAGDLRKLQQLVRKHQGNLSAMATALTDSGTPITRQALTRKLDRWGLLPEADALRAAAGVSGPRMNLPGGSPDPAGDAARLLDRLAKGPNYQAAADALGISRRTLFRRLGQFKITPAKVARRRRELAAQAAG